MRGLQEDFSELVQHIETGAPEPFYRCSRAAYNALKDSVYRGLKEGMTVQEAFRAFYPLVQVLNDAHFAIYLPDSLIDKEVKGYLPVRVLLDGDRIYVLEDLSPSRQLAVGDTIYAINGISAGDLVARIRGADYARESDRLFFESRTNSVFHKRLYPLFGLKDTFELETVRGIHKLAGIPAERVDKAKGADYVFETIGPDMGYIKINSLANNGPFQRDSLKGFLERSFRSLRESSVTKLIVDIRGNLGGSSVLAKDVLDYFAPGPYTLATGMDYHDKDGPRYAADEKEHMPSVGTYKFKGKVALLSDVLTYSSAHMMQVGFLHYGMGATIGQVSPEPLYITGEIRRVFLKNSGIEAIAPTVNFRLPGYSTGGKAYFVPDHVTDPALTDRLQGRDVQLQKAIEVLK